MNNQKENYEILLIEDCPGNIRLTLEAFKEAEIKNKVNIINNGEDALNYLHREGKYRNQILPDIILLDLNMPKMDGRELLKEIKRDPILKCIPVIVLTTSGLEEDIIKSYDLHANCYIKKPNDMDQFVNIIKSIHSYWLSFVTLPPKNIYQKQV